MEPRAAESVVVSFEPWPEMRPAIEEALDGAEITYLSEVGEQERAAALGGANAVLAWAIGRELSDRELEQLGSVGLIQTLSAGVDHVPFDLIPPGVQVASNAGAYSEPMAEHVLALALALAKRLPQNHAAMAAGEFDQLATTRELRGSTVLLLGYGGIGRASGELFGRLGAQIRPYSRGDSLAEVLPVADIVVIALPLTRATRGLIGARELALMKPDAILVNVARAAIVDEDALYEHLRDVPTFSAGLDVWWEEPRGAGGFRTRRPFFDLPNVLGSPHVSGNTSGAIAAAARQAAENVGRYLRGGDVVNLVDRSEYLA
jgi:phosphoglycerate dehydrogenase-like enzyme